MSNHLKNPAPNQSRMEQDKITQQQVANDNQKHSWDTQLQYGGTMDRLTEQIGKSIADKVNQWSNNRKQQQPANNNQPQNNLLSKYGASEIKSHVARPAPSWQKQQPSMNNNSSQLLNKYGAAEVKNQTSEKSTAVEKNQTQQKSALAEKYVKEQPKQQQQQAQEQTRTMNR